MRWTLVGGGMALAATACVGSIGDGDSSPDVEKEHSEVRAPLRRLTRFEYNNTVRDLFGDDTAPGNALPADAIGNGFGNDADALSVSSLLIEKYADVAEEVAERAATASNLKRFDNCVEGITPSSESNCAKALIGALVPAVYRRPAAEGEITELVELYDTLRVDDVSFFSAAAGVIEAMLQSPDFLYRPELGESINGGRRLTGWETATRLSYFLWSTTPDEALRTAAAAGQLDEAEGVALHARRMLTDERARPMLAFFFDTLLPIGSLPSAERSEELFPDYTPEIGELMHEETQRFLMHLIFAGEGRWPDAFTADYTFMNEPLAAFYGVDGVEGSDFQRVALDGDKRLGILTHASVLTGTTHSNLTSPVKRGGYIANHLLCRNVPFPTGALADEITPPEPYEGDTARQRYAAHSEEIVCAACHQYMDPMGLALENYDAVGRWRDEENGATIDASGTVPDYEGAIDGPVELSRALASTEALNHCFAEHWMSFAYGHALDIDHAGDAATKTRVEEAFAASEFDIIELIVALTQTPSFLSLPTEPE